MKMKQMCVLGVICFLPFFFFGCDKIEEAATKKVTVSNLNLSLTTPLDGSGLRATLTSFQGDTIFTSEDFPDLKNYKSYISAIQVLDVSIISSTTGNGTLVENFKAVYNTNNSYSVSQYRFGEQHKDDQLKPFAQKLLTDMLINNKEIKLSATGNTDESSAKKLTHTIKIASVEITIKMVDL